MHKIIIILYFTLLCISCSKQESRQPASEFEETDYPVGLVQIKMASFTKMLNGFVEKSEVLSKINHVEMDPLTRIININFTVNYPLENLLDFIKSDIPDINEEHEIEVAFSLPDANTVAYTRYLGITFHKLLIDGDDYINTFEIVAAVAQTVLANSNLIDYLFIEDKEKRKDQSKKEILKDIIENNGIIIYHTKRRINFKLDLSQFSHLNHYIEDYENLKLWSFSPSLFESTQPRFKIVVGEGKPSDIWMEKQLAKTKNDNITLRDVRKNFYTQFTDYKNLEIIIKNYQKQLLSQENITPNSLPKNYQNELTESVKDLLKKANKILTTENDNFIADPEYEYIEFINYSKRVLRNSISDMDKRLSERYNILAGGNKNSNKMPLLTQYLSQEIINGGLNFLTDKTFKEESIFKEISLWPMPQLPGVQLRGTLNLPIEYLVSKLSSGINPNEIDSKLLETKEGVPFRLTLHKLMQDNGKLQLDIKQLELFSGNKTISLNKKSKNQTLMFDLVKLFLAQSLASLDYESSTESEKLQKRLKEIRQIQKYIQNIKKFYAQNSRSNDFSTYSLGDTQLNPFMSAGLDFVETKKKILLSDIITINRRNGFLEVVLNPELILDDINKINHQLTIWDAQPIYSKELDNTFIKVDIGHGTRSNQFIKEADSKQNLSENYDNSTIYYDLNKKKIPADAISVIDFKYLESYVNYLLADIVNANKAGIKKQANDNPGETFYQISHMDLKVGSKNKLKLDLKIKSAKKGRDWYAPWNRSLKEDTYALKMDLVLKSKEINLDNSSNSLIDLKYYKNAISVNPTNIKVSSGSRNIIKTAITTILNSAVKLSLNVKTIKKFLLHIVNKFLKKMYSTQNKSILGHSIEKRVRLYTTSSEILLFLNPRVLGAAFDIHLTDNPRHSLFDSIKIDEKNQKVHIAFTGTASMAKVDKLELMNIVEDVHFLLKPYLNAKSKLELEKLLSTKQLYPKLIINSDKSKLSIYKRFLSILEKYDSVLHTTHIPNQAIELKSRISATGVELMYFAGTISQINEQLKLLIKQMKKYDLHIPQDSYYSYFVEAQEMMEKKLKLPLIEEYGKRNHDINETIIKNKISYWTFLFYADAYFSESVYNLVSGASN